MRCGSGTSGLVSLPEVHFVLLESMGITRLEQPSELRRHNDRPNTVRYAPLQNNCRDVYSASIQKKDWLQVSTMPEGQSKDGNDPRHQVLVVPCTLLPDEVDIFRRSCLQSCERTLREGRLVTNEDLWEQRLDVGPVADESDMRQTGPSFCPRRFREAPWQEDPSAC